MFATASLPIHLDDRFRQPAGLAAAVAPRQAAPQTAGLLVSRPASTWQWRTAMVDALELLGVVWSLPFVIIAIGAPVAFVLVAILWLMRSTLGAF